MILDAGILKVYRLEGRNINGIAERVGILKFCAWFGYLGIGVDEWNQQDARGKIVVGRVRILQDRRIESGDIIILHDGTETKAGRIWHGKDVSSGSKQFTMGDYGIDITDITLERPERKYILLGGE